MKKVNSRSKTVITMGMVALLVCAAVSAQATGFTAPQSHETSAVVIPLLSSIAFAFARKRS